MFFQSWERIFHIIITGTLAYVGLISWLRISGKRTMSKMNAFDMVITVAFGSALSSVILSKDAKLLDGIITFGLLVLLQFLITFIAVRSKTIKHFIKAEPHLLYYKNDYDEQAMKHERVMKSDILQAVRAKGIADMAQVEAVVLETDGSLSIIKSTENIQQPTIRNVKGFSEKE